MSSETAGRTIAVVAKFNDMEEDKLSLETSLKELEMDSLDGLNLIFELEEEFDIVIPDEKALTMETIEEMVEGIDRLLEGETPEDEPSTESTSDSKKSNAPEDEDAAAATGEKG